MEWDGISLTGNPLGIILTRTKVRSRLAVVVVQMCQAQAVRMSCLGGRILSDSHVGITLTRIGAVQVDMELDGTSETGGRLLPWPTMALPPLRPVVSVLLEAAHAWMQMLGSIQTLRPARHMVNRSGVLSVVMVLVGTTTGAAF